MAVIHSKYGNYHTLLDYKGKLQIFSVKYGNI